MSLKLKKGQFSIFPKAMCKGLPPYEQLVFIWIVSHTNDEGKCFPSFNTLADECGMSRDRVMDSVKSLVTRGYITKQNRDNKKKGNISNLYTVNLIEIEDTLVANSHQPQSPIATTLVANSHQPLVANSHSNYIQNNNQIQRTKNNISSSDDVRIVFDYWRDKLNHPKAVLDGDRIKVIKRALKNFSVDDCKLAIDGCAKSEWHKGDNPRNMVYDKLSLILRDAENIEKFKQMTIEPQKITEEVTTHERTITTAKKPIGGWDKHTEVCKLREQTAAEFWTRISEGGIAEEGA